MASTVDVVAYKDDLFWFTEYFKMPVGLLLFFCVEYCVYDVVCRGGLFWFS